MQQLVLMMAAALEAHSAVCLAKPRELQWVQQKALLTAAALDAHLAKPKELQLVQQKARMMAAALEAHLARYLAKTRELQ